jgi:hypothetical protein
MHADISGVNSVKLLCQPRRHAHRQASRGKVVVASDAEREHLRGLLGKAAVANTAVS